MHTCKTSNKSYIGQTVQKLSTRTNKHISTAKREKDNDNNCAFHSAINRYGWDDFETCVLIECDDYFINYYEMIYIEMYGTLAPHGYNLTIGGDGCIGYKHTEEAIAKISASKRTVHCEFPLLPGMTPISEVKGNQFKYGFKYTRDGDIYTFTDNKNDNLQDKFDRMMECKRILDNGGTYSTSKPLTTTDGILTWPKFIQKRGNTGFIFDDEKNKTFSRLSKKLTRRQNLIEVLKYFIKVVDFDTNEDVYTIASELLDNYEIQEDEEKVQRLNGNGEATSSSS